MEDRLGTTEVWDPGARAGGTGGGAGSPGTGWPCRPERHPQQAGGLRRRRGRRGRHDSQAHDEVAARVSLSQSVSGGTVIDCSAGSKVTGGGTLSGSRYPHTTDSYPSNAGTRWVAWAHYTDSVANTLSVYAVCMSVEPSGAITVAKQRGAARHAAEAQVALGHYQHRRPVPRGAGISSVVRLRPTGSPTYDREERRNPAARTRDTRRHGGPRVRGCGYPTGRASTPSVSRAASPS